MVPLVVSVNCHPSTNRRPLDPKFDLQIPNSMSKSSLNQRAQTSLSAALLHHLRSWQSGMVLATKRAQTSPPSPASPAALLRSLRSSHAPRDERPPLLSTKVLFWSPLLNFSVDYWL
nr:hypothetical protein Iba_chr09dCG13010 [Ipomoea batatas]GMD36081.1 hypothetical protein Iba_chr09dCG13020 [Ipomoea batatas]